MPPQGSPAKWLGTVAAKWLGTGSAAIRLVTGMASVAACVIVILLKLDVHAMNAQAKSQAEAIEKSMDAHAKAIEDRSKRATADQSDLLLREMRLAEKVRACVMCILP